MSQRKRRSNESQATQTSNRNSKPTPTSITSRETEMFAMRGAGVQLPKERAAVRKVIMFPFVGDPRNPIVGPRVTEREFAAARNLVHRPTSTRKRCTAVRAIHYTDQAAA